MDCKEGTIVMVRQIEVLLDIIDQEVYSRPLVVFNGSSLGQHFRHILDFYTCLQQGVQTGLIDYSNRSRNSKIEKDKTVAKTVLVELLQEICSFDEEKNINVKADFSSQPSAYRPLVASSVGREMLYVYDHAIHHIAIIRMGIQTTFPDIELSEMTGFAPSTLKYRAGVKATGS